ncbi:coniferyl aldehyde dehydrogenase [Rhodococcus sp. SRB_17]|uniref:aldehyde dehydrogenase family protein n=1 Tax=Rhodococcus sp. OK302 TaxID=1882769 RepID=UPI000B940BE4|nr:aldehyde dehydrogenase family protein [Rhodococcus sp. OK302]NMM88222.1 coniferyl aldehyde dehydrogenase [Rhodococcus sp. SRB_17]OYD71006.1 coniferyl-aldehyde dehydrogenase [Rhodococcus sp. OK302]
MTVIPAHPVVPVDPSANRQLELLRAQRDDFLADGPPSAEVRLDRIDRFLASVLEHGDELTEALDADFGNRPRIASLLSDIAGVIPGVEHIRNNIDEWMADQEVTGSDAAGTPTFVQIRPKGVVGVIGPWNFPVLLVVHPAIEALAAGNRIMIKFSEIPSRTADVFAKAIATRMSPEEVVVIRGGVSAASTFSDLPFDHIIFTGSPAVGALVAENAGRNLVPVTLELGGKNPVVLGDDADVAFAAERISGVRMMNGGQICLCPDYVFVPRAKVDDFVNEYRSSIENHFSDYPNNPGVVTIVNDRNFDRVTALIDDAVSKGARAISLVTDEDQKSLPDRASRRIAPTLLLDVTSQMTIATEEIFGPVIVVHPYDELTEAIDHINAQPSPLAAYWFGSDSADFREYIRRTTSGGVTRNDLAVHWGVEGAPSGGIGRSGMGAYSGKVGFDTFSHHRTVTASTTETALAARVIPPAGDIEAETIRAAIGYALDAIQQRLNKS